MVAAVLRYFILPLLHQCLGFSQGGLSLPDSLKQSPKGDFRFPQALLRFHTGLFDGHELADFMDAEPRATQGSNDI